MKKTVQDLAIRYPLEADQREQMDKIPLCDIALQPIREECFRQSLPYEAFRTLVWRTIELTDFELNGRGLIKTKAQALQSLHTVEMAATALRNAMEQLSSGDLMTLDSELFKMDFAKANNAPVFFERATHAQREACQIAAAARAVRWELQQNGAGLKGRKSTLPAYAGHIAKIACQLMPYDLKPGDGGPFRRLCDTVFQVAKVRANAQGAIVYFNKEMRDYYKDKGYCL